MRALAFDYETHLIGPDVCGCGEVHGQFPPPVCLTWADDNGNSDIETPADGLELLAEALDDEDCLIIGAETAFDVFVSCYSSGDFDTWLDGWIQAYKQGRVRDVLIRKRLLDAAAGRFEFHTHSDGNRVRVGHDLAAAAKDTCGIYLDKGEDTWRKRYSELDGVPFSQWPAEAIGYAKLDPEATGLVYEGQENWRTNRVYSCISEIWEGRLVLPDGLEPDPLQSEIAETQHALWLKCMSGHVGVMIDPFALEQYESRVMLEYTDLCAVNRKSGLLRREYKRELPKMRALGSDYATNRLWSELKAALDVDDPDALEAWAELRAEGLVSWKHVKNAKQAQRKMFDVHMLAGKPVPHTKKWDPEQHAADERVSLDGDACRLGGLLETELDLPQAQRCLQPYADLVGASKIINTDIPKIRPGISRPISTHFTSLKATGRTSSSNPPLHNRARGDEEVAGDRECFVPTLPDWVYIDIDYPQLELYCLAQCCKWILGYSSMGDALLLGRDLHLDFGAEILTAQHGRRITYEELDALKGEAKSFYKKARQAAKGANFGRPGGLGANTMVGYAAKSYGVYLPVSADANNKLGWKELLQLWSEKWHEMPEYFDYINSCETFKGSGEFLAATPFSGLLRAGDGYTAICNHNYQALGAVVAKRAGWYLFLACYERGVDDALYGSGSAGGLKSTQCRPGHFIHDQFLSQVRRDRVDVALPRVEHWCRQAAIEVLPDYGGVMAERTHALAAKRWSKESKRLENKGKIEIWEDARLFAGSADE